MKTWWLSVATGIALILSSFSPSKYFILSLRLLTFIAALLLLYISIKAKMIYEGYEMFEESKKEILRVAKRYGYPRDA